MALLLGAGVLLVVLVAVAVAGASTSAAELALSPTSMVAATSSALLTARGAASSTAFVALCGARDASTGRPSEALSAAKCIILPTPNDFSAFPSESKHSSRSKMQARRILDMLNIVQVLGYRLYRPRARGRLGSG
mmetsp:Transcript_18779/g.41835  ORF Transcript_18779/g.41835 Transcript_18779/m.41835 type:complete len:135 (-) Transcript_18779:43-447(-)